MGGSQWCCRTLWWQDSPANMGSVERGRGGEWLKINQIIANYIEPAKLGGRDGGREGGGRPETMVVGSSSASLSHR